MKIKSYVSLGFLLSLLTVVLLFVVGFFWYVDFPHDDADGFGAIHIVFNTVIIVCMFVSIFSSIACFFMSNKEMKTTITIPRKVFTWSAGVLITFLILGYITKPFSSMTYMYNKHIEYKNQYDKICYERQSYFDKMYKTYLLKNSLCELNKETFIETTKIIMDGRHDGEKVAWKWVNENQQISYDQFSAFYNNLSDFVQQQREGYYKLETQAMDVVTKNNTMLDTWPYNWYNCILKLDYMKFNAGFTSTHTDNVFNTKHEDL